MSDMKNIIDIIYRLDTADKKFSNLKDMTKEIIQNGAEKKKKENQTHTYIHTHTEQNILRYMIGYKFWSPLMRLQFYNYLCIPCMALLNVPGTNVAGCQEAK